MTLLRKFNAGLISALMLAQLLLTACAGVSPDPVSDANRFATRANEAVFWSGRTNGIGGVEVAGQIAAASGGTTLEQLLEKRKIAMPVWDAANPTVVQAWKDASLGFAQGARGELKAVIGQTLRPGSVWETTELPALKGNPQVRKITVIDPASRAERVIFER